VNERGLGVAVVGAGSWGTTVAGLLAARGPAVLWARSPAVAEGIERTRENRRYLPGISLPPALRATALLADALEGADLVLVAVPSHGFRAVLELMRPALRAGAVVVSLAKGIEAGSNLRMSEVIAEVLPGHAAGVMSGPNLAHEVAGGRPAATLVALPDEELARRVQVLLHGATFRVYTATDVVGCEIAGASKNVIAIAVGISDGLGFGENTRALLVTRGLAEQARLGVALGGSPTTFGGLAGIGDLVATCTSVQSRNRSVGYELGRGRPLAEILSGTHQVAEGVGSAGPIVDLARANGVEMPIAQQVAALVIGGTTPAEAVEALMERPPRSEWGVQPEWGDPQRLPCPQPAPRRPFPRR
jgi:glycerol-3-phosphate dehydrogenase (NAD(P)+)